HEQLSLEVDCLNVLLFERPEIARVLVESLRVQHLRRAPSGGACPVIQARTSLGEAGRDESRRSSMTTEHAPGRPFHGHAELVVDSKGDEIGVPAAYSDHRGLARPATRQMR